MLPATQSADVAQKPANWQISATLPILKVAIAGETMGAVKVGLAAGLKVFGLAEGAAEGPAEGFLEGVAVVGFSDGLVVVGLADGKPVEGMIDG